MGVRGGGCHRPHAVVGAVEGDRPDADRGLLGQAAFDLGVRRIARHQREPVPVRLDHDLDEVRIVESGGAALERGVVELPARRPQLPQQAGDAPAVPGQAGAAALAMEVVLVPEPQFVFGRLRLQRPGDVLDVVAVERKQPRATLRPQRRHDAGRAPAPVVAGQHRVRHRQCVHQGQQVRSQRRLLARAGCVVAQETRRPEAAQEGHDDAATGGREDRRHLRIGIDVVREAVHQEHRRPIGGAGVEVGDVQDAGGYVLERLHGRIISHRSWRIH